VTPVLIGLLLAIGLALAVIAVVAYPHLREGAPLLTPEGERLAREARQRAQSLAGSAADSLASRDRVAGGGSSASGSIGGRAARTAPGGQASSASTGAGGPVAAGVPGPVSTLRSTRLVWASPPPQLRPDAATPPPGTASVGGRGVDAAQQPRRAAARQESGTEPPAR
jgi:hypothetical protein